MARQRWRCGLLAALLAGIPGRAQEGGQALQRLFELAELLGHPTPAGERLRIARELGASAGLSELKAVAARRGLSLLVVEATVEELVGLGRPCLVLLDGPSRAGILVGAGGRRVQLLDQGEVRIESREEFEQRFSGFALAPDNPPTAGPRACFQATLVERPDLALGRAMEQRFQVHNTGGRELEIEPLSTSCACTAAVVGPSRIAPGETGGIRVAFQPEAFGEVAYTARLRTSDPLLPTVFLTVWGTVERGWLVSPARLDIVLARGQILASRAHLIGAADQRIIGVNAQAPYLTVGARREEQSEAGAVWRLDLHLRAPRRRGEFETVIEVETDDADHPFLQVPIRLRVLPCLRAQPEILFLGRMEAGGRLRREIRLTARDGESFGIRQVESPDAWLAPGEPTRIPEGYAIPIVVQCPADRRGYLEGRLRLHTTVPGEEQVEIPVAGWVETP